MAQHQQEGGWPLGLQPLMNVRVALIRNFSFNTLTTASLTSSSTGASSDLDSKSNGSFFQEKSITLGSLIGITSFLDLSNKPHKTKQHINDEKKKRKGYKVRDCFSFCTRAHLNGDDEKVCNVPSLGHLLEVERRACIAKRNITCELQGLHESQRGLVTPTSLFSNGIIALTGLSSVGTNFLSNMKGRNPKKVDFQKNRLHCFSSCS